MRSVILSMSVALLLTACVSPNRSVNQSPIRSEGKAVPVEVKMKDVFQWETPSDRVRFFVQTDSVDVPMICMRDNAHLPSIKRYLARERRIEGKSGVLIDVYFNEPVSFKTHEKGAFSLNLWQPNLTATNYPVRPTNGKKF